MENMPTIAKRPKRLEPMSYPACASVNILYHLLSATTFI